MGNIRKHVAKDGRVSWRAQVRFKNKQEYATFTTKKDAQEWVVKTENDIITHRFFPERLGDGILLETAITRYIEEILCRKGQRSQKTQLSKLLFWKNLLGDLPVTSINSDLVTQYMLYLWREKQYSSYTVNSYIAALSHLLTMCCEWHYLRFNPCTQVKKLSMDERLPDITDRQIQHLIDLSKQSSSPYLYPFVILSLSTGGRYQEILTLKWTQIDFRNRRLVFKKTKSKRDRSVPLNSISLDILHELYAKTGHTPYVFYSERRDSHIHGLQHPWEGLRRKANLPHLRIHDLRHIYASRLATRGKADIGTIAHLLGHSNLKHTRRYVHLTEDYTAEVVERMSEAVFGSLG